MGGLFSKSQPQKSKDPRWQGIGPNTPLPNSPSSSSHQNQSGFGRYGAGARGPGNTLTTIDTATTTTTTTTKQTKTKVHKSSKFNLLLKLDPKGGQRRVITKNLISLPSDFRHTGHIGAGEVRSGQIDPEKIKNQMMEVFNLNKWIDIQRVQERKQLSK
ncbi:hypothetical protein BGZ76_002005 [Entomortierella beljakovae]|nr:hypothetical protein BGZ76_002005 [Entomortierella beljakovae]